MLSFALSTSVCERPSSASELMDRWQALVHDREQAVALDARVGPEEMAALLAEVCRRKLRCTSLVHPRQSAKGKAGPSPASGDRQERQAARERILATLHRARDFGVEHVVLFPTLLDLATDPAGLRQCFALAREPDPLLQALSCQRAQLVPGLVAGLSLVLEPLLRRAQELELTVLLPVPSPWPHHLPGVAEVEALLDTFRGAPLAPEPCTDWVHLCRVLGTDPGHSIDRATEIRVADACGLTPMLPLGTGEADWAAGLAPRSGATSYVLTLRPGCTAGEVRTSHERLAACCFWNGSA